MKTSGMEFFYSVSGLMVPKYIVDDQFNDLLDYFVEWVSEHADELEAFVNYELSDDEFVQKMIELYTILCSIHAHWLEIEAARILRLTDICENDLCRKLTLMFITNLRTLAVDIQMAQNEGFENAYDKRHEIERCKDVINSMRFIAILVRDENFKMALDTVKNIDELRDNEYYFYLISAIEVESKDSALILTDELSEMYIERLNELTSLSGDTSKKLVIVDDMPEILATLSYMLKEYYQVFSFSEGKDALDFIDTKQKPDAFLLDIDMPDLDGFALAREIRSRAAHGNTPILFLTASGTNENIIKSLRYDPKAFIIKPVNKDIIVSKLSSCLK